MGTSAISPTARRISSLGRRDNTLSTMPGVTKVIVSSAVVFAPKYQYVVTGLEIQGVFRAAHSLRHVEAPLF